MFLISQEVRTYQSGNYEVEFFVAKVPFEIEDAKVLMVFTSGASDETELVMTCSEDSLDHAIECLDAVLKNNLGFMDSGYIPEGDDLELDDGSGKKYSLIDVTDNDSVSEVYDYFVDKGLVVDLLQVFWPDINGAYPNDPSYDHSLVPQPILC